MPEPREIHIIYAEDDSETRTMTLQKWEETRFQNKTDRLVCERAFADGQSALDAILQYKPDVAVLDIYLSGSKRGLQIARDLYNAKRDNPELEHVKVLLLSSFDAPLAEALKNFEPEIYQGLIDKHCSYDNIIQAISDVYDKKCVLMTPKFSFEVPDPLEKDILMRAACLNQDIAVQLRRPKESISRGFTSICSKLRVPQNPAAFLVGLKIDLFSIEEALEFWKPAEVTIDNIVTKDKQKLLKVWKHLALLNEEIASKVGFNPEEYMEDIWACFDTAGLEGPVPVRKTRGILCALCSNILTLDDFYILDNRGQVWQRC
jgi:DNA-binding NarL/FixJ family response regulator